jgi:acylphosphatase
VSNPKDESAGAGTAEGQSKPPEREVVRVVARVAGRVQGVFFRGSTLEEAQRLGIYGEVRNLPDGSVEIIAEAERRALEELLDWCRKGGPPSARVEEVEVRWSAARGEFQTFRAVR